MGKFLAIIDMTAAIIGAIAFVIVAAKFVTKRINCKAADRFLMKIHKPAGYTLLGAGLLHGILSFRTISTTPIMVYILGTLGFLCIIAAIAVFIFRKKLGKKWVFWHGICTVVAFVSLILHMLWSQ